MVQQQKRIRGEFIGNRFPMGKLHGSDMYRNSKVGWFLRKPNWKNIQLQQFEKNLYQEHPHTAGRSMAEVEDYRNANGAQRDYTSPTCIEAHCWPIALSCRNFLGIAETGSHKALAYVLPAVINVSRQPPRQRHEGPIALVVAPTRELAKQIHIVASELGEHAGLGSVCAVSGDCRRGQCAELQKGCHILVATPGRLIKFLDESKVNLHHCTYLVLVDVDRMIWDTNNTSSKLPSFVGQTTKR
ncbi:ATP-dependent RNA helicase p62 [Rhipicephalus microplus]|uniref:ATP-dependent RNA helicase p62 n=1 Tax=Rhipicephalus microplus TaxID=6941 RepID=UPI003F6BB815